MRPLSELFSNHPTLFSKHPTDDSAEPVVVTPHDLEAPDAGEIDLERPETMISRQSEAPDVGEGRAALLEQEFTRGRSRS